MNNSIGLIESKGLVALVEATDVILKNSPVKVLGIHKLDNGLVSLAISGNSDYVKAAIETGTEAGRRVGEIYASSVIDNPTNEMIKMFSELFSGFDYSLNSIVDNEPEKKVISENLTEADIFENFAKKIKPESKREKSKPLVVTKITTLKKNSIKNEKPSSNKESEKKDNRSNLFFEQKNKIEKPDVPLDSSASLSTIERLRQEALGLKSKSISSQELSVSDTTTSEIKNDADNIVNVDFEAIDGMNVHKLRHYAREFPNFPIKGREISRANRDELVELFKKIN
ncbi:MAG: BMC domain-containing protein [Ignavibacteriaceae bacterium]